MFCTVGVVGVASPAGPHCRTPIWRLGLRARIKMVSTGRAHTNGTIQTQRSLAWVFWLALSCPHWKAWGKKEGNEKKHETCLEIQNSVVVQILLATKWEIHSHLADVAVFVFCVYGLSCNLDAQNKSMFNLDKLTPSGAFTVSAWARKCISTTNRLQHFWRGKIEEEMNNIRKFHNLPIRSFCKILIYAKWIKSQQNTLLF